MLTFLLKKKVVVWQGTVRLLFQPAEEGGAGAGVMIEDGALGAAQAIFGFHVDPSSPVGSVKSKPGPLLAGSSSWEVEVTAQGGHAAFPNRTADPILTTSSLILSLQQLVSRECDPLDTAVNSSFQPTLFSLITCCRKQLKLTYVQSGCGNCRSVTPS